MMRSVHIVFLLHFLFAAADPWMVIHTCAGETNVEMMSVSAEDPCGCMDGADAPSCCTVEVRSFQLDAGRPAAVTAPVASPDVSLATLPDPAFSAVQELRLAPACTAFHPPGQPSLSILHCALLV